MWSYECMNPPELYHHGVRGMKWGIRRYQNSDGSLTSAGKKRRVSESLTPDKKTGKNQKAVKPEGTPVKKKARELTDDELRTAISRKRLEDDYNKLFPVQVSKGKKFTDYIIDKVVVPAATDAAKQVAKEFLVKQGKIMVGLPAGGDNKDKK